jgi:2',3'-cyclic-nucleotide 2'-phosphodiesterase/3'-nucleotidase
MIEIRLLLPLKGDSELKTSGRFIATVLLLAGTLPAAAARLTILETSDLHGHIEAVDELAQKDFGEGLARVSTIVRRVRAEGNPVLLLDDGDTIEGTPLEALHAASGAADDPMIRAMNAIGFDALCVGNHDFNFGLPVLDRARREARFPFLSANTLDAKGAPRFAPYTVFRKAGLKIGVLGLTVSSVPLWESPDHIAGLRFRDTVETAKEFVAVLRKREKCDVVIVLTHQGFERDPATGDPSPDRTWASENHAYALATEVPGIDLLLAGHAHQIIAPIKIGSVWTAMPGRFGNTVARFDIDVERGRIAAIKGQNLAVKDCAADPPIEALVAADAKLVQAALGAAAGRLESPVSFRDIRARDNAALDWLQRVQLRDGGAELSFASSLSGRLDDWNTGALTVRDIWRFYPYENRLVTVRASGKIVREALEQAAKCFSGLVALPSGMAWKRNPAVFFFNCDSLSGADYAIDPSRPEGSRVLYLRRAGREIADSDSLTVALNSYRAGGAGGFPMWRRAERLRETKKGLRELLVEDARKEGTLALFADWNWVMAPGLAEAP